MTDIKGLLHCLTASACEKESEGGIAALHRLGFVPEKWNILISLPISGMNGSSYWTTAHYISHPILQNV